MSGMFGLTAKQIEQQHKLENARHALVKAYEYMGKTVEFKEKSPAQYASDLADAARALAKEMEKDLNETLKVLEESKPDESSKTASPKLH